MFLSAFFDSAHFSTSRGGPRAYQSTASPGRPDDKTSRNSSPPRCRCLPQPVSPTNRPPGLPNGPWTRSWRSDHLGPPVWLEGKRLQDLFEKENGWVMVRGSYVLKETRLLWRPMATAECSGKPIKKLFQQRPGIPSPSHENASFKRRWSGLIPAELSKSQPPI